MPSSYRHLLLVVLLCAACGCSRGHVHMAAAHDVDHHHEGRCRQQLQSARAAHPCCCSSSIRKRLPLHASRLALGWASSLTITCHYTMLSPAWQAYCHSKCCCSGPAQFILPLRFTLLMTATLACFACSGLWAAPPPGGTTAAAAEQEAAAAEAKPCS
jgi:hypothetical protein